MLGFSAQAAYACNKNPISLRDLKGAYAINALIDAHSDDPAFGYRFLSDELKRAASGSGNGARGNCVPRRNCDPAP